MMKTINKSINTIYFLEAGKKEGYFVSYYSNNINYIEYTRTLNDSLQFLSYKDALEVKKELKEKFNINLNIYCKKINIKNIHSIEDIIEY